MTAIKLAVIGGGSSYTPELIEGIIKRKDELPVKEIHLVDIKEGEEKLNIVGSLAKRMLERAQLDTRLILSLNRKESIKDADYIITQFRVGGLKARVKDETIPLKYNVLGQETTGAGGFAKALRTIPVILEICKEIESLSPRAWLINFTNPAGLITEAILKHTNVKAIGLCNIPINMKNTTAKLFNVEPERIRMDFIGLNHLSWAYGVYLDGKDIMEEVIRRNLDKDLLNMKSIPNLNWNRNYLTGLNMLPSPYLRYYYMVDEIIKKQLRDLKEGKGSRGEQVMKIEEELFRLYRSKDLDKKPSELEKRGGAYYSDAAISLISAIHNNKGEVHTVNIKNKGAITNLDENVVIECNALIDKTGATPLTIGRIPREVSSLVHRVKAYEVLAVDGIIRGDYKTCLMALSNHPLTPSLEIGEKILKDFLQENKDYYPY